MPTFLNEVRKLCKALTIGLDYFISPNSGEIVDIGFFIGIPARRTLPLYIIINGEQHFLCNICDTYPAFENLRFWMEHILGPTSTGTDIFEMSTIDSASYRTTLLCANVGHEGYDGLSLLVITKSGNSEPILTCFCRTQSTILNLYSTLQKAVRDNSAYLDTPGNWVIVDTQYNKHKISQILTQQIESNFLDSFTY